jgi:hypothetical protein
MSATNPPENIKEISRADVVGLRQTMKKIGVIVAEVDHDLRYVWIENPHPDFDPAGVVGKRDDELVPPAEAAEIMGVKRAVLQQKEPVSRVLAFKRSDGWRHYSLRAYPVTSGKGCIDGVLTIGFETQVQDAQPNVGAAQTGSG